MTQKKKLRSLNPTKVCAFKRKLRNFGGYPAKALKNTLSHKKFPDELKLAVVTPIYKKDDPNKSKNYSPVSVLLVIS